MPYDYTVYDSSLYVHDAYSLERSDDNRICVGIVREKRVLDNGQTRYIVEVLRDGRQIPMSCVLLQRFGGVHNYEEFDVRPWVKSFPANLLPKVSAGKYGKRAGDVVVVAPLNGDFREGIILGGIHHPARTADGETLEETKQQYVSVFNGLATEIRDDGSYKVTFKGRAVNDALLDLPPFGQTPPKPIYNPLVSGSFFGFDKDGSFMISDDRMQLIKMEKSLATGNLILKSGQAKIELSGTLATGKINMKANEINMEGQLTTSIKSTVSHSVESLQVSIKGQQMAIGNDRFELFQGLSDLIDALGTLVVTSPVGTCTPLMAAPTWASKVLPIQILIKTMTTSLKSASSAEFSGDDSTDSIGDDLDK